MGDLNPARVDPAYAETGIFHGIVVPGVWGAGLISAVLDTRLPGPGTIYLGQELRFRHPVDGHQRHGHGDTESPKEKARRRRAPSWLQ